MGAAQDIERTPSGIACPVCGFTQADFKKTGRLGCSACYDVFGESLESMLKNMHKGSEHVGKSAREPFEESPAGCSDQKPSIQP
jgi:protein arginine kinase activator